MEKASVSRNDKNQTIKPPKSAALPDDVQCVDVVAVAVGRNRIITPEGRTWEEWFDGPGVSDDFMTERNQPSGQYRDGL